MCYTLASRCASLAEIFLAPRSGSCSRLVRAAVFLIGCVWGTVAHAVPILYVSADAGAGRIYAIEPGQPDRIIETGFGSFQRGMTLGPDGFLCAGGGVFSSGIAKFDPISGARVHTYNPFGSVSEAYDMRFGSDGHLYVASSGYVVPGGQGVSVWKLNVDSGIASPFATGLSNLHGLTFGPDGHLYAGGNDPVSFEAQIRRYNGSTGEFIDVFAAFPDINDPHGMEFGPDGNLYVTDEEGSDAVVRRLDGATGALIDTFASISGHNLPYDIVFGPHDGHLYMASQQGIVKFDGSTGDFLELYADPPGGMKYMVFAPVPEPSTAALLVLAFVSSCSWSQTRRRKVSQQL